MTFKCPSCDVKFSRRDNLKRHFALKHSGKPNVINCFLCGLIFDDFENLENHHENFHQPSNHFEIRESAFQKTALSYRYVYSKKDFITLSEAQNSFIRREIRKTIYHETAKKNNLKFSLIFLAEMNMFDGNNLLISRATIPFRSTTFTAVPLDKIKIKKNIASAMQQHANTVESFINNGSNWVFNRPVAMDIEVCGVNAMMVGANNYCSSELTKIPNSKHLANVPSKNDQCFLYCIAEALYGDKIKNKKSYRDYKKIVKKFNVQGLNFPTMIKDVKKFVKINPKLDLKLNILFFANKKVFPFESGIGNGKKIVNLLIVQIEDTDTSCNHFVLIKNLDKFLSKVYKNEKKSFYQNCFYCSNCLNKFSIKQSRDNHYNSCILNRSQIEKVPNEKNNKIKFTKYENQFYENIVGYLDFECELSQINDVCEICKIIRCECETSYTRLESIHKPICFSFAIINKNNKILYEKTYSGENACDVFLDDLLDQEKIWIKTYLDEIKEMKVLSKKEQRNYDKSTSCYICRKEFSFEDPKVRDHDHCSGFFIGPAHRSCNLKRRRQKFLRIFLHNGSRYDNHFIIKSLVNRNVKKLYVLPFNMENFRMIKFNSFMILDSLAFLPSSLAKLSDDLKLSDHSYPILRNSKIVKTNDEFDEKKFQMMLRKGVFCYEFW